VSGDEISVLLAVCQFVSKPIGDISLRGADVGVFDGTGGVDDVEQVHITGTKLSLEGDEDMDMGLPISVEFSSNSVSSNGDCSGGLDEVVEDVRSKVKRDVGLSVGEEEVVGMIFDHSEGSKSGTF